MRLLQLQQGRLRYEVLVAETFGERLRGLIGRPPNWAMLLPGRSVHSIGMRRPVMVVALDADFRVVEIERLEPMRLCSPKDARWLIELPIGCELPTKGETLRITG